MKRTPKESAAKPARLIVADDHHLLRTGIVGILASEPGFEVVGEAEDGLEAVALCGRTRPDLALMDVQMPNMDGLEATREIKAMWPRTCVVMVTAHDDPEYIYEALKAGAAGYVLKHAPPEELVSDMRKALAGDSLLPQAFASTLLARLAGEGRPSEPGELSRPLSLRELEVARLMARGLTNRQISRELDIAFATAKNHVEHIIAKLEASDRTQAAVRAIELGLIHAGKQRGN